MQALAHPLRLRILLALRRGPLSPPKLAQRVGSSLESVTRQLRALRSAHLVERRSGSCRLEAPPVVLRMLAVIETDPWPWS